MKMTPAFVPSCRYNFDAISLSDSMCFRGDSQKINYFRSLSDVFIYRMTISIQDIENDIKSLIIMLFS